MEFLSKNGLNRLWAHIVSSISKAVEERSIVAYDTDNNGNIVFYSYLEGENTGTSTVYIDPTLSIEGSAADAKAAGDKIAASTTEAKQYTDQSIATLINSAPTTLDTLGEIAAAMEENADVVDALEAAIGGKADAVHTHTPDQVGLGGGTEGQILAKSATSVTWTSAPQFNNLVLTDEVTGEKYVVTMRNGSLATYLLNS